MSNSDVSFVSQKPLQVVNNQQQRSRSVPKRESMDEKTVVKQRSLRKGRRKSSEADGEEMVVKKRRKVGSN